jgi:hypothetical protein
MRDWILRAVVWFCLPGWDRKIFWEACDLADRQVFEQGKTQYYGGTKHAIAYERIRTILVKSGIRKEDITGAVVHLAVAFRYLLRA